MQACVSKDGFFLMCFYRFGLKAVHTLDEQLLPEMFGIFADF